MLSALLVLFTRLDAAALLESPARRALVALVVRAPGMRLGEAARVLGVDYKTAAHHARHLSRAGQLVVVRDGRARRCYLPGARIARVPRAVCALRAIRGGASSPVALGRALGIPRGTAGSLIARLVAAGLVEHGDGPLRISARAEAALLRPEAFSWGPA
jgi:DNA-binding MarR family transcriptional regulator